LHRILGVDLNLVENVSVAHGEPSLDYLVIIGHEKGVLRPPCDTYLLAH